MHSTANVYNILFRKTLTQKVQSKPKCVGYLKFKHIKITNSALMEKSKLVVIIHNELLSKHFKTYGKTVQPFTKFQ